MHDIEARRQKHFGFLYEITKAIYKNEQAREQNQENGFT